MLLFLLLGLFICMGLLLLMLVFGLKGWENNNNNDNNNNNNNNNNNK